LDDNLFIEDVEETATSNRLGEEDKDLLENLKKKAAEIEGEADDFS
jgi:hypothetical protein